MINKSRNREVSALLPKQIFLPSRCQVGQKGFVRLQEPRKALEAVSFRACRAALPSGGVHRRIYRG